MVLASKAKPCVCARSGQLARERSRLLKAEKCVNQAINRLVRREEALDLLEEQVSNQERELLVADDLTRKEELSAAADWEASKVASETSREKQLSLASREQSLDEIGKGLQERRRLVQGCSERVESKRRELDEEQVAQSKLRCEIGREEKAAQQAETTLEALDHESNHLMQQLLETSTLLTQRRLRMRQREDTMELEQADLHKKEASLQSQRSRIDGQRAETLAREARLEGSNETLKSLKAKAENLHKEGVEAEERLAAVWDDIHQRQQVLDDISSSLEAREEVFGDSHLPGLDQPRDDDGSLGEWLPPRRDVGQGSGLGCQGVAAAATGPSTTSVGDADSSKAAIAAAGAGDAGSGTAAATFAAATAAATAAAAAAAAIAATSVAAQPVSPAPPGPVSFTEQAWRERSAVLEKREKELWRRIADLREKRGFCTG